MALEKLFFVVKNAPGPFRIVSEVVKMCEQHGNKLVVDLTVTPIEAGKELLGHEREFRIPFEAALIGATTKYGHHVDEPRNIRLLGRFLITQEVQNRGCWVDGKAIPFVDPMTAAAPMNEWQWEVVFNPQSRRGFVAKLETPLPKLWYI